MRQFDNDADGGLGSESWATAFADAVTQNSVGEDLVTLYADAIHRDTATTLMRRRRWVMLS